MTTHQFIFGQFLVIFLTVAILLMTSCDTNTSQEENTQQNVETKKPPVMDLHSAVFLGNKNALQEHINYGTDLNVKDAYGSTPLNIATTFGKTDLALMIIDAGADINARNSDGGTALHTAAFFCRTEILEALLIANAKKDIRNKYGSTPLESVSAPWEVMQPIYEQVARDLGALGLRLDFNRIENTRPQIAVLLK